MADPDAPELLRKVEALDRVTAPGRDLLRYRDIGEAALLPLLKAVAHREGCEEWCAGQVECSDALELEIAALRAVAEALGEPHG